MVLSTVCYPFKRLYRKYMRSKLAIAVPTDAWESADTLKIEQLECFFDSQ